MRGDYWVPNQETLITRWEHFALQVAIEAGYNVIFDSTNLNPKTLKQVEDIVNKFHYCEIEYKLFDTPLETCIERDSKRKRPVGSMVIKNFYNRYFKSEK